MESLFLFQKGKIQKKLSNFGAEQNKETTQKPFKSQKFISYAVFATDRVQLSCGCTTRKSSFPAGLFSFWKVFFFHFSVLAQVRLLKTTERQCTRRKEEEITMYYELYLEVKATATKHSVLHFILAFS